MQKTGKDYIVFPLDVPGLEPARKLVEQLDGQVGMFKIGLELFIAEGPAVVRMIKELSQARIFLDLKLHDISATVGRAMDRVADLGVDLVTVHCASREMLEAAVEGGKGKAGVLGVTLLTDNDAAMVEAGGFKSEFVENPQALVLKRAGFAKAAGCAGVVCSGQEAGAIKSEFGSDFLAVTPGIRPQWSLLEKDDQKRVTTPADAVSMGSDLIVIGRPIREADSPAKAAEMVAQEVQAVL
ncbi:MAG: orotidine-5'-phosphate decarboxylase [Desulfobacterales bacterium]|nr:orotidine-5'-phosphate decarboxylase [Desulfobacterales bacterium]